VQRSHRWHFSVPESSFPKPNLSGRDQFYGGDDLAPTLKKRRGWAYQHQGQLENLVLICDQQAGELAEWPIAKVEEAVRATDEQRAALDGIANYSGSRPTRIGICEQGFPSA
jgi:hypothetical protein